MLKKTILFSGILSTLLFASSASALTVGETVNVKLVVLENGVESTVSSSNQIVNSDGQVDYEFTGVKIPADSEFLLIRINDDERIAVIPAPGDQESIDTAATPFTKKLALSLLAQDEISPLVYAFTSLIIRSPEVTDAEAELIANGVKAVVQTHDSSMLNILDDLVGKEKRERFEEELISNATLNLKNYTALLKESVEAETDTNSKRLVNRAANKLADIIMEALIGADIPLETFMTVFNTAGEVADSQFTGLTDQTNNAMSLAINSFHLKLKSVVMSKRYETALTAVNSNSAMVTRATNAITTLTSAIQTIENQYAETMFDHEEMSSEDEETLWRAFHTAFQDFQTNMASLDSEITTLIDKMATAMNLTSQQFTDLAGDEFGTRRTFDGESVNMPINETAAMTFVADLIIAGGELTLTRDTIAIPSEINEWIPSRTDFVSEMTGAPTSIVSLFGLTEDVQIIEATRWSQFEAEVLPGSQVEENFGDNLETLRGNIGGISNSQKKALINLMLHPEI